MQKIVVVPKDAEVIPSENGHAFLAGVLLKVTAFWMRRIIKIMGERPAVVAVFRLSCGELPGILDKAAEEEPEAPTTKICPRCKSEVNIEATRCPFCTSDL